MFKKLDEKFTEAAADPVHRLAAITDLTNRRSIAFWLGCLLSLFSTVTLILSSKSAGGGLLVIATFQFMIAFKYESDLRLLKVIERLQK
jgi:hypothetical protein